MKKILLLIALSLIIGSVGPEYDLILVRSDLQPDWIIAQAYAHKSNIPLVTTLPNSLDENVKAQLEGYKKAGFERMIIIGGEEAISLSVQREIDSMGISTHRISEADRYGTSARVAVELYAGAKECIVVNGEIYEGMLTAQRMAGESGMPILFIKSEEIPGSVSTAIKAMGIERVVLVDYGVSDEVKRQLISQGHKVDIVEKGTEFGNQKFPTNYIYFIAGLALGAFAVLVVVNMKKKEKVSYTLLTDEEEKVVKIIQESGGEMMQDLLPEKTGFSRPKVSRIVSDLTERNIISKEPFGRTQKLVVKKEFYGEKKQ